jgi:hypothetical protein
MRPSILGSLFLQALLLAVIDPEIAAAPRPSQCVQCHTNVKGLIRLSWEVEKLNPKSAQSAETAGEG